MSLCMGGAGENFPESHLKSLSCHWQAPANTRSSGRNAKPHDLPTDLRPVLIVFSECRSGIQSRAPRLLVCGGVGRACLPSWKAASSIPASAQVPKLLQKSHSLRECATVDHVISANPPTLVSDTPSPTFGLILCLFH